MRWLNIVQESECECRQRDCSELRLMISGTVQTAPLTLMYHGKRLMRKLNHTTSVRTCSEHRMMPSVATQHPAIVPSSIMQHAVLAARGATTALVETASNIAMHNHHGRCSNYHGNMYQYKGLTQNLNCKTQRVLTTAGPANA